MGLARLRELLGDMTLETSWTAPRPDTGLCVACARRRRARATYEAHLAQCESCREELAYPLTEAAAALAWAVESADAAGGAARAHPRRCPGRGARERRAAPSARRRLWQGASAVAACAAPVGLGIWAATLNSTLHQSARLRPPRAIQVVAPSRGATGMVAVTGRRDAVLVVDKLPSAPVPGMTYEAWVIPKGGTAQRAGTFKGGGDMATVHLGMKVRRVRCDDRARSRDEGADVAADPVGADLEAENVADERERRLERAPTVSPLRKPCPSPAKAIYACGIPLRSTTSTIASACAGGTTLSSSPWSRSSGRSSRSAKWTGERARYRSARSGYGPISDRGTATRTCACRRASASASATPK